MYWTPLLIHALLEGGAISVGVRPDKARQGGDKSCSGHDTQLRAVLLTLVPFGLAAAASLAIGHSSEVSTLV